MRMQEIADIVRCVTGIDVLEPAAKTYTRQHARYVAIMLMVEEGYSQKQIRDFFRFNNQFIYTALKGFGSLICYDKEFKQLYWDCLAPVICAEDYGIVCKSFGANSPRDIDRLRPDFIIVDDVDTDNRIAS